MFKSLKEIFDSKESLLTKPNSKRDDSEDRKEGRSGSQTQTLALPLCLVSTDNPKSCSERALLMF